jgi:guanine deaminase
MTGLQAMVGADPTLYIQTHLAENPAEIEFTKQLFPFTDSYTHGMLYVRPSTLSILAY